MLMLSSKTKRERRRTLVDRWRQWHAERRALDDILLNRNRHLLDDAGISREDACEALSLRIAVMRWLRPGDRCR
jgi:uncharacterized protein YjiS (DUF1127 family)